LTVFQGHDRQLIEGQVLYANDGRFRWRGVAIPAFPPLEEAGLLPSSLLRVPGGEVAVERVPAILPGPTASSNLSRPKAEPCAEAAIGDV
jgi:phenylacetate-CoA ligase